MNHNPISEYTIPERSSWVSEVRELYKKVKAHSEDYSIDFLGKNLTIKPNIFSPKYFNNTKWYAEKLTKIIGNSSLLEIGTGTGAIALHCYLNGATVVATDINPNAVYCAKENFEKHNCNIQVFLGDVYEPVPENKFDYIFWNHPYNNSKEIIEDTLIIAGFDYRYKNLTKYIEGASQFLSNPNRGLLVGTGGQADLASVFEIARKNNYSMKLLDFEAIPLSEETKAPNDFRIYELLKNNDMKRDDLWRLHTSTTDSIKIVDSKALLIVGVIGILATFYLKALDFEYSLLKTNLSLTFLVSSIVYSLISTISAILALNSNLNDSDKEALKSNIFFKDISTQKNLDKYLSSLESGYDIDRDLKSQIFIISKIATKKHTLLQWSVAFLGFAIFAFIVFIMFAKLN